MQLGFRFRLLLYHASEIPGVTMNFRDSLVEKLCCGEDLTIINQD